MVYYYAVVASNKGEIVTSQKKCDALIASLADTTSVSGRCASKKEARQFIADRVVVPPPTRAERAAKMIAFLLKPKKVSVSKTRNSAEYTNDHVAQYDDGFVPDYYVYTDGACSKNGAADATAGVGVFFGTDDPRNVARRLLPAEGHQTNNAAELAAIIDALAAIKPDLAAGTHITVLSDSKYSIRCATSYGAKCAENGWSDPGTPNKELVRTLFGLFGECGPNVRLKHVRAHTKCVDAHSLGNKQADALARQGACAK